MVSAFFLRLERDSNEKRDPFPAKVLYGVKMTLGKTMMDGRTRVSILPLSNFYTSHFDLFAVISFCRTNNTSCQLARERCADSKIGKRMRMLQLALISLHLYQSLFLHSHVSNCRDMTLCAIFDATAGLRLASSRGLSCSTQRVGRTGASMFDGVGVSGLSGNGAQPSGFDPRYWIFGPRSIIHRTSYGSVDVSLSLVSNTIILRLTGSAPL